MLRTSSVYARALLLSAGMVAAFGLGGIATTCLAQSSAPPSHVVDVNFDSGPQRNLGSEPVVVWNDIIEIQGAQWLRLEFSQVDLGQGFMAENGSTIRIVSMLDGAEQTLNTRTAREWQNTSAYFNGDSVAIELTAYPNGNINRVVVDSVVAGDIPGRGTIESICDGADDRVLSDVKRAGRSLPAGCTAWIIDDKNHCMLTAGHCASFGNTVVEFNVPLSNGNGSIVHPGPEDQYSVDPISQQFVNGGIGNDWAYFGCFENSETGLTAYEAQGDFYELAMPTSPQNGDNIRITGYGVVSPPVDPTWNQAQKTHAGPYWSFSGSTVGYRTDTSGGNSGSAVFFEPTGKAIGIHTHGGCRDGSGNNWGTGVNNAGFQNALANPQGVCASRDCIDLTITNLVAGQKATFTVEKGSRGSTVAVLWSNSLGSFKFSGSGWCVDFGIDLPANKPQSRIVMQGFFDQNGNFTKQVSIPGNTKGMGLAFQGAVKGTCPDDCMSNVVEATVQ